MHVAPTAPSADPLPWVTAQMDRQRVFDMRLSDATRMRAALDVLTGNVAALHDDHPYRVVLSKGMTTAGTAYNERLVLVGSKGLNDESLTKGQRAAVTMGLVLHEVGHVRWGREYDKALEASPLGNSKLVGSVSNLAADMHNERAAMDLFPGLALAVEVAMWWVCQQQGPVESIDLTTVAGRANAALAACRYPWQADWSGNEDWLATWTDWAKRAEQAGTPEQHVAIVGEALDIIRTLPEPEPEPEPDEPTDGPTGDKGEPGEPGDEGEDGDDQPGEPGDEPGEPGDEPTDGDEPGDDDGDDDGDEPGGSNAGDDDADEDADDDDPGEGNGPTQGGDDGDDAEDGDDGQGMDADDDDAGEPGDDGDGDGSGESGDDEGSSDGDGGDDGDPGDDSSVGSTGAPTGGDDVTDDPTDENSDDIKDACAAHTAHDEQDEMVQQDIDRVLLKERTSGDTYVYRHSTSVHPQRTVKVAKKTRYGFNI